MKSNQSNNQNPTSGAQNNDLIGQAMSSIPATSLEAGQDWRPAKPAKEIPVPFSQYKPGMYQSVPSNYFVVYRPRKLWSKYVFIASVVWIVISMTIGSAMLVVPVDKSAIDLAAGILTSTFAAFITALLSLMIWRTRVDTELNTKKKWHSGH